MGFFLGYLVFSVLVGVYADMKGRSGVGWFVAALFISPLIAWIACAAMGEPSDEGQGKEVSVISMAGDQRPAIKPGDTIELPEAETGQTKFKVLDIGYDPDRDQTVLTTKRP